MDVASENSDDDSPTTIVRAEAASVQLDVSSADFRLLSGCVSENLAERPATIPDVVNPAWMDPTRRVASKASVLDEPETPLAAVDERDENAAADDDAKQSSPSPRSSPAFRRPSASSGWNPSVSPDGPTIATTLFSARVPAVELGLYRGEGRAEPLAMLVVRELAVDVASLEGGASAVAVAVAAFALEDFRDAREPRTVARGGAVDDSGNDTLGRRLPLLAAEIVTGPAVGGARVDVTLQRLRVEAEPTFLLDVGRVFVPTLAGGGGEAPEDVLPADVRVRPGEPFRLDADLELGSTRRVLADAVAGASYVLDGGGRSIVVRESELDRGPLVFVGPGATLEIRDARLRVASEDGAETAWASVARLAPGANLRARARDGVVFETLPTAFGDGRGDDRDRVETIVRAEAAPVPLDRLDRGTSPSVLSVSFRATRLELCVVGDVRDASSRDSEGTGNVGSRPIPTSESPDAVHLTLGVAMEATVETDDATRETDVQARLVRVCARDGAGGDVVSPTDVTARYVSREDTLGNPTEDARITVGASPVSLSLSAERVATLARVASRLAAAAASAPTRRSRVFRKIWSSDETTRTTWAPSVFDEGAPNARVGAAAWSVWRPNPPAGYASLGDVVASGVAAPPAESSLVVRDSPAFTAPPLRFERETFSSPDAAPGLVAWRPIPPEGFAALGVACAPTDAGPPKLDAMRCVRVELVAAADGVRGRCAAGVGAPPLWILENRAKTCETSADGVAAPRARLDLRVPTGLPGESRTENATERAASERAASERAASESVSPQREAPSRGTPSRGTSPATMTAVAFRRVWWDYNSGANSRLSVWRPICPPGWCSLGDVAVPALEPPASTLLVRRDDGAGDDPRPVAAPVGYERAWRDSGWRATRKKGGTASFWRPVPPPGYVACGHVASASHAPPPIDAVVCLRFDLTDALPPTAFADGPAWTSAGAGFKLGRAPLAVYRPRASDRDVTRDGLFFAVGEDGGKTIAPPLNPKTARAPARHARPSPAARDPSGQFGIVATARFDVVDATVFVDAEARAAPLARVSLRRVSVDARASPSVAAECTAVVDVAHFNPRVAAWEPALEPWSVDATYDGAPSSSSRESFSADLRPDGTTLRVSGATPFRAVLTHAFADDVIAATARARRADAAVPARRPVVNALGVDAWVRTDGGRVTRVPPGATLPRVGLEKPSPPRAAPIGSDRRVAEPTYLLVEVLATDRGESNRDRDGSRRIESESFGASARCPPAPLESIRFTLDGDTAAARCVASVPAGDDAGAALVDVTPWRVRRDARVSTLTPLRVRCELAPTSNLAVAAAFAARGADAPDTATASRVIEFPADAFDHARGWFPSDLGEWFELERPTFVEDRKSANRVGEMIVRAKLRAKLVEGLELTPARRVGGIGAENDTRNNGAGNGAGVVRVDSGPDASDALRLLRVHRLELAWWSRNTGATTDMSAWTPVCPPGFAALGSVVVPSFNAPPDALVARAPWLDDERAEAGRPGRPGPGGETEATFDATAPAAGFELVWSDSGSRRRKNPNGTLAAWRVIPPPGFVAVGSVMTSSLRTPPDPRRVACVRADLARDSAPAPAPLWSSRGAGEKLGKTELAVYRTGVAAGAGMGRPAGNASSVPKPSEIRWETSAGARVEEETETRPETETETIGGGVFIGLGPNGPWAPAGARSLARRRRRRSAWDPPRASAVVVDRRDARLRAPATLASLLPVAIEARLSTRSDPSSSSSSSSDAGSARVVEVFESERFFPFVGWQEPKGQLDEFFTARFNDARGAGSTTHFPDQILPEGWIWTGSWSVDRDADVDEDGWAYAVNWVTRWPPPRGSRKKGLHATRRRRWIRTRAPVASESRPDASGAPDAIATWRTVAVEGDIATPLPLGCGAASAGGDPNLVLDVRIRGGGDDDEAKTRWASDAVGSAGGVLLGVSSAHWPVPVGRIGAPDARGPWLAACADASSDGSPSFVVVVAEPDDEVSSAGAADPLGDGGAWGLVARAPITIQTALPCACAYVITYSRTRAIAARGIASPGEPARVLSADPRQALTLELVPLDDAGEIAGACVGAVSLTAGDFDADARAPKTKEALVELRSRSAEGHAAGANAVARFAVTVERGRASARRGAAAPFGGRSRAARRRQRVSVRRVGLRAR